MARSLLLAEGRVCGSSQLLHRVLSARRVSFATGGAALQAAVLGRDAVPGYRSACATLPS